MSHAYRSGCIPKQSTFAHNSNPLARLSIRKGRLSTRRKPSASGARVGSPTGPVLWKRGLTSSMDCSKNSEEIDESWFFSEWVWSAEKATNSPTGHQQHKNAAPESFFYSTQPACQNKSRRKATVKSSVQSLSLWKHHSFMSVFGGDTDCADAIRGPNSQQKLIPSSKHHFIDPSEPKNIISWFVYINDVVLSFLQRKNICQV